MSDDLWAIQRDQVERWGGQVEEATRAKVLRRAREFWAKRRPLGHNREREAPRVL